MKQKMLLHATFRLLVQSHFMATLTRPYVFLFSFGVKQCLYRISRSFSNLLSDSLFLFRESTNPPKLNSRCTGALDGVGVLYFMCMWGLRTDSESQAHTLTLNSHLNSYFSFCWEALCGLVLKIKKVNFSWASCQLGHISIVSCRSSFTTHCCQKLLHMLSPMLISQPSKFELGTIGRCKKSFLAIQYSIKTNLDGL